MCSHPKTLILKFHKRNISSSQKGKKLDVNLINSRNDMKDCPPKPNYYSLGGKVPFPQNEQ